MVKVGDQVGKGDIIFEVETDKATLEMESPADGFVKYILTEEGCTLSVGEPLMVLGGENEDVPQSFVDSLTVGAPPAAAVSEAASAEPVSESKPGPETGAVERSAKIKASPRAKKLAGELGVELAAVTGTGPAGRITEEDVKNASSKGPGRPGPDQPAGTAPQVQLGQTVPVSRIQTITAERMLQSKREIPCFYLSVKADVTELVKFRNKLNKTSDVKVSYNDFIIIAVAIGLEKFPMMTGQLAGDEIRMAESIGVGLAIAVPDGLVAPIVQDVNKKTVSQIARESKALIERARSNKLSLDDLKGGCITVSNLGALGIESFIPVVVPGQTSILGIGQIADACVPEEGNILVRKMMSMTLSVDHKVTNGAYAAQFLEFVKQVLEDPSSFA
jgi:pyruvate dehydrogenase E2 component (dihydrolipoamide acetyltransferase)